MITSNYRERNDMRQLKLETSTMAFVQYFIDLGDDMATAQSKVSELSTECAAYLYPFVLGNTQPLINAINASSLPFMDAAAKSKLTGDLSA